MRDDLEKLQTDQATLRARVAQLEARLSDAKGDGKGKGKAEKTKASGTRSSRKGRAGPKRSP